ncbi:MAG TPA: DUF2007 domain-containing protein, partial [Terriglobia bacterium]|nr:DUF2007 domain-containing protein [Terriglobia bacterium]
MMEWVIVYTGTIVEVDLLKCLLEGEGIQCILQNENIGMIAPHCSPAGAGVRLAVDEDDLERAVPI